MRAAVRVPRPSGRLLEFAILLGREPEGDFAVREDPASPVRRLPACCPERHINADGSFCLFWRAHERPTLNSLEDATAWWARIVHFLEMQRRAAATRRWPRSAAWAHGDGAAELQRRVELALRELGLLRTGVSVDCLRLRRSRAWLRLESRSRRLFSVRNGGKSLPANLRQPCPCGRVRHGHGRVTLKKCGEHADVAARLVRDFAAMEAAEHDFAKGWLRQGMVCCGSAENCCLAR